jgi:sec-independent protein translocase protein TatC
MARLPRRLGHAEEATLGEHLEELRGRLFVMLGALVVGTIVAYVFHNRVLDWLNQPLPPQHRHLYTFGVAEPFTVTITVCLYAGFVLALPVVLWQLWLFFAPAVGPGTERKALGLSILAVALGAAGMAFGYWILLPRAVHFLTNYDTQHFHIAIRASAYYNFVVTVLVGVVLLFQTPLVVLGLVYLGVLSSRTLRLRSPCRGPTRSRPSSSCCRCGFSSRDRSGLRCSSSGAERRSRPPRLPWAADG